MRARPKVIVGVVVLGILGACLHVCRTPPLPSALIQLVGYQKSTNSILATILVSNTGPAALSYWNGAFGTDCAVRAHVGGVETNFDSGGAPLSMSWEVVVWRSHSTVIHVKLPVGTESWRVSLPIRGASARNRIAQRMMESGLWNRAFPVSQWLLRLFPMNNSAETQLVSPTFQVTTNSAP